EIGHQGPIGVGRSNADWSSPSRHVRFLSRTVIIDPPSPPGLDPQDELGHSTRPQGVGFWPLDLSDAPVPRTFAMVEKLCRGPRERPKLAPFLVFRSVARWPACRGSGMLARKDPWPSNFASSIAMTHCEHKRSSYAFVFCENPSGSP